MAQYTRTRILVEESDVSDYSKPRLHEISEAYTPDDAGTRVLWSTASGAATTFWINHLTTVTYLVVENLSSVTVELTFSTNAGTTGAVMDLPTGETVKLVDIKPSGNLVVTPASGVAQLAVTYGGAA